MQVVTREPKADKPVAARVPEAGMQEPKAGQVVAWATQACSSVQKHRFRQALLSHQLFPSRGQAAERQVFPMVQLEAVQYRLQQLHPHHLPYSMVLQP